MTALLTDPVVRPSTAPSQRLRTTTAAVRVSLSWLGTRKTLTSEQKSLAADAFGAEGAFLSAGKKLLDTKHPAFKAVTRRTIHQFRVMARKALSITRGVGPPFTMQPTSGGLLLRVCSQEAAVELRLPGDCQGERICAPFELLDDCQAKNDEPVTLTLEDGNVVAQWTDGNVPQLHQYDQPEPPEGFPSMPTEISENSPELLRALADARETADPDSLRYALGCMQFRSERGRVVTSDGHQLLVQSGFAFPWEGDILVPVNNVYGCSCLPTDQLVQVGHSEDWFTLATGPWTLHSRLNKDGRFPTVEDHVRKAGSATTTLRLTDADAKFVTDTIRRLPGDNTINAPVTVDLNGQIAIRAKSDDRDQTTEVILSNSSRDGKAMLFNTNRAFLARAAKLGFREIELDGAEAPAHCRDERRVYIWALLGEADAIKANKKTTRIKSPVITKPAEQPITNNRTERTRTTTMAESNNNTNGNGRKSAAPTTVTVRRYRSE